MGKIYAFILGMAAGAGLYHFALTYHVVRASDGLHLVAKAPAQLKDTYVDIRGFTAADAVQHPELGAAIVRSGDEDLQSEFAGSLIESGINRALEGLRAE